SVGFVFGALEPRTLPVAAAAVTDSPSQRRDRAWPGAASSAGPHGRPSTCAPFGSGSFPSPRQRRAGRGTPEDDQTRPGSTSRPGSWTSAPTEYQTRDKPWIAQYRPALPPRQVQAWAPRRWSGRSVRLRSSGAEWRLQTRLSRAGRRDAPWPTSYLTRLDLSSIIHNTARFLKSRGNRQEATAQSRTEGARSHAEDHRTRSRLARRGPRGHRYLGILWLHRRCVYAGQIGPTAGVRRHVDGSQHLRGIRVVLA